MAKNKPRLSLIQGDIKDNNKTDKTSLEKKKSFPGSEEIERQLREEFENLVSWIKGQATSPHKFSDVEQRIIPFIFRLGCMFLMLYLTRREEAKDSEYPDRLYRYKRWYERKRRYRRTIITFLGKVTYWRMYYYAEDSKKSDGKGHGLHPLDQELGLTSDKFSLHVVSLASRLATMMPFACTAQLMRLFVGESPSERAIEQMVLGLGTFTHAYFEQAFPPQNDGEILVIMIDCKAIPTATVGELRKRRGKRENKHPSPSARHRGRDRRRGWKLNKRRPKGGKRKNGRCATLVVMYTLKLSSDGKLLLGPINKKVYGSFAPKRYAFEYARRQAEKRGFTPGSNRMIQFVSDGDDDFRVYLNDHFGDYTEDELKLTLDVIHVMGYIWTAGGAHFAEGSEELEQWAQKQKTRLLESRADIVLSELHQRLDEIPQFGPGNKSRRKRTESAIKYIEDNWDRMDYRYYIEMDLEIASGAVEGAVNHVIGSRLDHGGMRWIVERAESVLQLRCIMLNGDWDDFILWVQKQVEEQYEESPKVKLLRNEPVGLPSVKVAA